MSNVLYQIKTCGKPLDGMGYIISCDDGSIVVIDGSYDEEDVEIMLHWLRKITKKENPVIDAWLITHAHPDHHYCLKGMGEKYADIVTLKKAVYAFPDNETFEKIDPRVISQTELVKAAVKNFKGCEVVTPKLGDLYQFGSLKIEVLLTYKELLKYNPNAKITINDTSTVYRVEVDGQKILFAGDIQEAADRVIIDLHGENLKSDAVQMAHHGCGNGSNFEFYERVNPRYLLWPANEKNFWNFFNSVAVNRKMRRVLPIEEIFMAGEGTRAIPLPVKTSAAPFIPDCEYIDRHENDPLEIPFVEKAPDINDPFDGLWEEGEMQSIDFVFDIRSKRIDPKAKMRVLWDGKALYYRITVLCDKLFSDPLAVGSAACDNIRLYLSEEENLDECVLWKDLDPKYNVGNLKIFREEKEKFKSNTNIPERCSARTFEFDGGYIACARLELGKKHSAGELLTMNVEVSVFDEKISQRSNMLSFTDIKNPVNCAWNPYFTRFVKLK